jgi:ArsR family transcriptional regulator, arsenate/arsenite/antimonite-responsive transcriptional repressor
MSASPLMQAVQIHKALGNPVRLRILLLLRGGPLCGCQLNPILQLAASTISQHLAELRRAGLVSERKEGRWVEYALSAEPRVEAILAALPPELEKDPIVRADSTLVRALRKVALEELCSVDLDLTRLNRPAVDKAVRRSREMLEVTGR